MLTKKMLIVIKRIFTIKADFLKLLIIIMHLITYNDEQKSKKTYVNNIYMYIKN